MKMTGALRQMSDKKNNLSEAKRITTCNSSLTNILSLAKNDYTSYILYSNGKPSIFG